VLTLRERKLQRWGALQSERTSWIRRYSDISKYMLPYSGRFFVQDRNRGDKSFNEIYDSTGTRALRILAAGMMAGMTSPARPWFRLATPDPDLMEDEGVDLWLNNVSQLMRDIFARSNTYRALHTMYEELGAFSTAANIIDSDFDTVIWNNPLTAGEYALATDSRGRVNTLYREFEMTVAQMVEMFGLVNVSSSVKNLWDTHRNLDSWRPVLHVIEPRELSGRDYSKRDPKNMAYMSCYLELGRDNEDKVLRESGYEDFPAQCPRWHTRGGDVYGSGPGMEALGDVKQLQHEQLRKAQGIDYMTLPPIGVPGMLKGREVDTLPGGVNYLETAGSAKIQNLFDVRLDLNHLLADINDVRQRINQAFYADLFLMISQDQRRMPVTAREIAERHEEKLLMLGPVLERLHDELLSPLIDNTFIRMLQAGILPPPPEQMQGMDLKVEFVSTLAQAQRAVGLGAVDRLIGTVALIGQGKQDTSVWDKIDVDQAIDKYSDMLAIDPSMIVADDKVAIIRTERAKQLAQQQALAAAPVAADAAKTASEVNPDNLRNVMQQFSGYT